MPIDRLTTGAWCIAEVLSDDWLSALANSFKPHFPFVMQEPYFDEVFSGHVEIVHVIIRSFFSLHILMIPFASYVDSTRSFTHITHKYMHVHVHDNNDDI
jgi:hypothetical protein